LVYMGVEVDPWSETPIAMQALTCGHWICPMLMNESPCMPLGTFAGTAKLIRCQVRPASRVTTTTDEPPSKVLPIRCGMAADPAA